MNIFLQNQRRSALEKSELLISHVNKLLDNMFKKSISPLIDYKQNKICEKAIAYAFRNMTDRNKIKTI